MVQRIDKTQSLSSFVNHADNAGLCNFHKIDPAVVMRDVDDDIYGHAKSPFELLHRKRNSRLELFARFEVRAALIYCDSLSFSSKEDIQ
jgi:hypothetical protein